MEINWFSLIIGYLITCVSYMLFPVILRIKNGCYEESKANKIALWNSIIIFVIDSTLIMALFDSTEFKPGPAVLYYFLNFSLLKYENKEKNIDNNVQNKEVEIKARKKTLTKNINYSLCTSCGKRIGCNDNFCKHCGKKVKKVIKYCRFCGNELNANFECEKCGKKYENNDFPFVIFFVSLIIIGSILLIYALNS